MTEPRGSTALSERPDQPKKSLPARLSLFYRQVIAELRKVIWPGRKQLVTYTTVVIAFVLVVIAFVTALDLVFGEVIFRIFG